MGGENFDLESWRDWRGTADGIAAELARSIEALRLKARVPSVRTVRLWRTKRLLSKAEDGNFAYRQVLEGIAVSLLLERGWTASAISDLLPGLDDGALSARIRAEASGAVVSWILGTNETTSRPYAVEAAEDAAILLAQGIIRLYQRVLTGRVVVRQDDQIPSELHAAMCKLGRLYIEEGQIDRAASVHDLVDRARFGLGTPVWGLRCFADAHFRFREAVLVEHDLRVPTQDCAAIASVSRGFGEDQVIEHRLHAILRDATERLGNRRRDMAYTRVRELLGRRSLISEQDLVRWVQEHELYSIQETILDSFFDGVPDAWLVKKRAHRCGHCGTLLRPHPDVDRFPDGVCHVRQCRGRHAPLVSERLDPAHGRLLVARPQILTYWTGPALDELAIFDAATRAGLEAALYPDSDACDVAVIHGTTQIGIDAKSYTSPVSLALRLNSGIGGLLSYKRRIIAVSDDLVDRNSDYIPTLRAMLDKKSAASSLEVLTVSRVINELCGKRDA